MGGCSVRAGVLSECDTAYPQVFFPCVVATQGRSKDKAAYGFDALTPDCRNVSKLHFPFRNPTKVEQVSSVIIKFIGYNVHTLFGFPPWVKRQCRERKNEQRAACANCTMFLSMDVC